MSGKVYVAIDLKSFYASVECVDRGIDSLSSYLVVADETRTDKTICLAVSPALKSHGIPGRPRLFEVKAKVKEINAIRLAALRKKFGESAAFTGVATDDRMLRSDETLELGFTVARPRMRRYMEVSSRIYGIYLRFVAPEDMHVYSVDEVFIDATPYLELYHLRADEFARMLVREEQAETGIAATAGIGTNLYLAKIAMDIEAKHMEADENGVRIASLDERTYREKYWSHTPITDFWRIGRGYAGRLEKAGMHTMGDVARMSVYNENKLYNMFGVAAELLIDHAWGWEPCTIADIHECVPENRSLSVGQVLSTPYCFEKAKLVAREMADSLAIDLVEKRVRTDQIVLTVGYDTENIYRSGTGNDAADAGTDTEIDRYGRKVPKSAHGSQNLGGFYDSSKKILSAVNELFDRIADPELTVRRMYVVANHVIPAGAAEKRNREKNAVKQLSIFSDEAEDERKEREAEERLIKERSVQKAVIGLKKRFGKNAVLRGMNLEEGATAVSRNAQVGGHRE
ncbi:MAG: DNA methylase [Clostridia bacterium]|nr:DNA methylase [Clostridia bacterium]